MSHRTCAALLLSGTLACTQTPHGNTLEEVLASAGPDDRIPVIITLSDRVNLAAIPGVDKLLRRAELIRALQAKAERTQAWIRELLATHGATNVRRLWLINGLAATVSPDLARMLLVFPGVRSVTLDSTMRAAAAAPGAPSPPEWNIAGVHAPALWDLGLDGSGAVVANMDTGVDIDHSDLGPKWRGGTDSWWDPYRGTSRPYDAIGHGTETMGLIVGGTAGGTAIGVAPGARWIAAKIYDDSGATSVSTIHLAFQWLLSPSGVPGAPDAPDVVNASWGLDNVNGCDDTFQTDFDALRAAGVVVVFAAGNSGPNPLTSISPANNVDGFSAGAVDSTGTIDFDSSRGPGSCTGGIYPDLVAPGVNVKTSSISLAGIPQFAYVSGTSFSAPHVAGVAALLAAAFPAASVATLEDTLRSSAHDLGPAGPDNDFGHGLVDAYAAYASLAGLSALAIVTTSLPDAALGVAYRQQLEASGGQEPYTWSLTASPCSTPLPFGLALDASSGEISGTPEARGTYFFVAHVTDAQHALASRALSITVP